MIKNKMGYNLKNWSVQQEILKRVNQESGFLWSSTPSVSPPIYKKCEDIKITAKAVKSAGWVNFIKDLLRELKP